MSSNDDIQNEVSQRMVTTQWRTWASEGGDKGAFAPSWILGMFY